MRHKKKQRGLTLYELLIVLAILAFLATLVAPRVVGYLGRAKTDVARTQMTNIATSLELYSIDMGGYPTADQGLDALITAPTGATGWLGPYLREERGLVDPWGRDYIYALAENGDYIVSSLGRDGKAGGEGEDADLEKR